MSEVQEQFSKLAESEPYGFAPITRKLTSVSAGKKTFSSLMTKVKAKMQEFDQSRYAGRKMDRFGC